MSERRLAVVLAAGRVVATSVLRRRAAAAALVVAADGGARHARSLGLRIDVVVGDLDSVDAATLRRHGDAEVRRFGRDKDELDLELALDDAAARGATDVLLVGAFGGRIDHELALVDVALARHRRGLELELHSGDALALPLREGQERQLELPEGVVVSLLPGPAGARVTLSGVRYELVEGFLEPGRGRGVSNRAAGGTVVARVHEGEALLVVPELPDVDPAGVIWGRHEERIDEGLRRLDPDLGERIRRFAYDEVFADRSLDLRTRELLALAHLISLGAEGELRTHVHGALQAGATPEELRALLSHAAMFVGFPRAMAAARVVRAVLEPDADG
jgi:thiamine pyrophosphokinase